MIGGPGGMKAEMQVEQTRVSVSKIAVGGGHIAKIDAPIGGRQR